MKKRQSLAATSFIVATVFSSAAQSENHMMSSPGFRFELLPTLDSNDSDCQKSAACKARTLIRISTLTENPAFFNILSADLDQKYEEGPQRIIEGYNHYNTSNERIETVLSLIGLAPNTVVPTFLSEQALKYVPPSDKNNHRITYGARNCLSYPEQDACINRSTLQIDPSYGRTDEEFRKYFTTPDGKEKLERVAYYSQRVGELVELKESPVQLEERKEQFSIDFKYTDEEVDQRVQEYIDMAESDIPNSSLLFSDMLYADQVSSALNGSMQRAMEAQKKITILENQIWIDNASKNQEMDHYNSEINISRTEIEENGIALINSLIENDFQVMDSTKIARDIIDEASIEPTYIGGKKMYSSIEIRKEFEGIYAGAQAIASAVSLFGDSKTANEISGFTEAALQFSDALNVLSNNSTWSNIDNVGDMTAVFSAFGGVMGAISFIQGMSDNGNELQETMFNQIFENQQKIYESVQDLRVGQRLARQQIDTVYEAVKAVINVNQENMKMIQRRFDGLTGQQEEGGQQIGRILTSLREDVRLTRLNQGLVDDSQAKLHNPSEDTDEKIERHKLLRSGLGDLAALVRGSGSTPPVTTIKYLSLLNNINDMGENSKGYVAALLNQNIENRRGNLAEIFAPLCVRLDNLDCTLFSEIPSPDQIQAHMFLYFQGANAIAETQTGKEFLSRELEINQSFGAITTEIARVQNASSMARSLIYDAQDIYTENVRNIMNILDEYSNAGLIAMGGIADDLEDDSKNDQPQPILVSTSPFGFGEEDIIFIIDKMYPSEGDAGNEVKPYLQVASYLGLAYKGEPVKDKESLSRIGSTFRFDIYTLNISEPYYITDASMRIITENDGGETLIGKITKGRLPNFVGAPSIALEHISIDRGSPNNKLCSRIYAMGGYLCVQNVSNTIFGGSNNSDFITTEVEPAVLHQDKAKSFFERPKIAIGGKEVHIEPEVEYRRDFEEGRDVLRFVIEHTVESIRSALVSQWQVAATGGTISFTGLPTLEDFDSYPSAARVNSILENLDIEIQKLEESRLLLDTAFRFGYGEDCISRNQNLMNINAIIENGLIGRSFFEEGSLYTSDLLNLRSYLTQTLETLEGLNSYPSVEILEGQCMAGFGGIELSAELQGNYVSWVQGGFQIGAR